MRLAPVGVTLEDIDTFAKCQKLYSEMNTLSHLVRAQDQKSSDLDGRPGGVLVKDFCQAFNTFDRYTTDYRMVDGLMCEDGSLDFRASHSWYSPNPRTAPVPGLIPSKRFRVTPEGQVHIREEGRFEFRFDPASETVHWRALGQEESPPPGGAQR